MSSRLRAAVAVGCGSIPFFHGISLISLVLYFTTRELYFLPLAFGELILVPLLVVITAHLYNLPLDEYECGKSFERAWQWNIFTAPHSLITLVFKKNQFNVVQCLYERVRRDPPYTLHALHVASKWILECHGISLILFFYYYRYPALPKGIAYVALVFFLFPFLAGLYAYCFIDHHDWEFGSGRTHTYNDVSRLVRQNIISLVPCGIFCLYSRLLMSIRNFFSRHIKGFP